MDGEHDGTQAAGADDAQIAGVSQGARRPAGAVGGGEPQHGLRGRDQARRQVELSAKVAEAAKTAEATSALNEEITALKQTIADERVETRSMRPASTTCGPWQARAGGGPGARPGEEVPLERS